MNFPPDTIDLKRKAIDPLGNGPPKKKPRRTETVCFGVLGSVSVQKPKSVHSVTKLFNNLDMNPGTPSKDLKRMRESQEEIPVNFPAPGKWQEITANFLVPCKLLAESSCTLFFKVEGKTVSVNKEIISKHSPFIKDFFYSRLSDSKNPLCLEGFLYQPFSDCMNTVSGSYKVQKEKDIYRAVSYLSCLKQLEMNQFLKNGETAVISLLDHVSADKLEEVICDIDESLYSDFCQGLFPRLREKLAHIGRPILIDAIQGIEPEIKLGGEKEILAILELVESLLDKNFPCYEGSTELFLEKGLILTISNNCDEEITVQFFKDLSYLDPMNTFIKAYLRNPTKECIQSWVEDSLFLK